MSRRIETTMEIERDHIGEVTLIANYTPARGGTFYNRRGDPGDPPEPALVENLHVLDRAGELVKFTDAEYLAAYDAICEAAEKS